MAAPRDGEERRPRVALADQELGRGDEVVDRDLFSRTARRVVPRAPVLAAAAHVRHGVDAAELEPRRDVGENTGVIDVLKPPPPVRSVACVPSSVIPRRAVMNIGTRVPSLLVKNSCVVS